MAFLSAMLDAAENQSFRCPICLNEPEPTERPLDAELARGGGGGVAGWRGGGGWAGGEEAFGPGKSAPKPQPVGKMAFFSFLFMVKHTHTHTHTFWEIGLKFYGKKPVGAGKFLGLHRATSCDAKGSYVRRHPGSVCAPLLPAVRQHIGQESSAVGSGPGVGIRVGSGWYLSGSCQCAVSWFFARQDSQSKTHPCPRVKDEH